MRIAFEQEKDMEKPQEVNSSARTSDIESQHDAKIETESSKASDSPHADDETRWPKGLKLAAIIFCVYSSVFLTSLDRTIIATAIPEITNEFNSFTDIGWYGSSFLLTFCAFQLLFGRIYTFWNPKWIFIGVIGIFEIGSIVCAAAPNSVAFILGRAIAGLGSAGMLGGAVIIMVNSIPLRRRPLFQGFIGAVFGIASVGGPLIGGAFTTNVTWRWCFWLNVPIGAVTMVMLAFVLHVPESTASKKNLPLREKLISLDPVGTALIIPGLVCILLALQWGGTTYAWSSGRIIALLTLGIALLIAFAGLQFYLGDRGTVPPRILAQRSVAAGFVFVFCIGSVLQMHVYYLPIWFQAIKGVDAVQSAIMNLPLLISLVIASILTGVCVSRFGYYAPFMIFSSIIASIGCGLITTFKPDTAHPAWIGYQVLVGMGIGFGLQQANLVVQTVLERKDVPTGIALMFFAQTLSGSIFISVGQSVLDSTLVSELRNVPGFSVLSSGATALRQNTAPEYLSEVVLAYNNALDHVFYIPLALAAATFVGAVFIKWDSVKDKNKQ